MVNHNICFMEIKLYVPLTKIASKLLHKFFLMKYQLIFTFVLQLNPSTPPQLNN